MANQVIRAEDFRKLAREADIQAGITDLLTLVGIPWGVTDASRAFGPDGQPRRSKVTRSFPDISAVLPFPAEMFGRALFVETKTAQGRFQPGQREKHEELRGAGAVVLVPRSLEQFARELIKLGVQHQALTQIVK